VKKRISVIVPIYNGKDYIKRCIQSIEQQNFPQEYIEVILIDDGSNDESLSIIEDYAKRFKNIIVIHQDNIGAAATRNKGILLSTGEYLTFVDQDDFIDRDYLDNLYNAATKYNCDVVQSGFKLVDNKGIITKQVLPVNTDFGMFLAIPAWAKIYRTEFIRSKNIYFFDNNIGEDSVFTINMALNVKIYRTIQYAGYCNSFDNSTNVTNTLHKGLSREVNIERLLAALQNMACSNELRGLLDYNIIRTCAYYLFSYGRNATPGRFIDVYKELSTWIDHNMPGCIRNRYVWISPKGELFSAKLGVILMVILRIPGFINIFATIYCRR